jgi:general secretion pathway protein C
VIFLLAYLADLTWRLMPEAELAERDKSNSPSKTPVNTSKGTLDLYGLKSLNLFGTFEAPADTEKSVTDAPETKLRLTLTGVVTSTIEADGAAIIENRGSQETYGLGDKIEGTNATLREVFRDRVIIRNSGVNETLMLDGIDFEQANNKRETKTKGVRNAPSSDNNVIELSQDVVNATRMLQKKPANFTEFISVEPYNRDGDLLGYQVKPGKKPELFRATGLKSGDVITDINGLNLTDPQQAVEAMNELRNAQSLQITINRDNDLMTLILDLPDAEQE